MNVHSAKIINGKIVFLNQKDSPIGFVSLDDVQAVKVSVSRPFETLEITIKHQEETYDVSADPDLIEQIAKLMVYG